MKNVSEQLLSFAENELIKKESIRCAVLSEAPQKQKKPVALTRILLPIAACFVLLCGIVFAIPQTRAEVLSWFRSSNPAVDYLTDPERTQTPVEDLVSSAKPQTPENLLYVSDDPIWQRIAADFSAAPREAFFDGENLYLSLSLKGLSALPSLDSLTGGNATAYDEDTPACIFLVLKDGTELSCGPIDGLDKNPDLASYLDTLTAETPEAVSTSNIEWLTGRELIGVAKCSVINPKTGKGVGSVQLIDGKEIEIPDVWALLLENADENGILTATVRYRTGADTGNGLVKLLEADLGTIEVDLNAGSRLDGQTLTPKTDRIVWEGSAVLSDDRRTESADGTGSVVTVTNTAVDFKGLTFRIEGGQIDALGIHDVGMTVTMPDGWTQAEREAFLRSLSFRTELSGELFYGGSFTFEPCEDGAYRLTFRNKQISYDLLDGARTIRLIPVLIYRTAVRTDDGEFPIPLNQPVEGRSWEAEDVEYDAFAIVLNVN